MPNFLEWASRVTVLLVRPENPENIGLAARGMKNTGFQKLRLVSKTGVDQRAYKTAVHAEDVLEKAQIYSSLQAATGDLDVVFAATAKRRKNFDVLSLDEAVSKIARFPSTVRIGLLFGNERTGLSSEEMKSSNYRFTIPQAHDQPSYNLAAAVLLTLFHICARSPHEQRERRLRKPFSRKKQEECIQIILAKLEEEGFIHKTNKQHMTERVYDLLGRLAMTDKDSRLLLAMFSKGITKQKE